MSQTLSISNSQWVDLNTLASVADGTRMIIDNVGTQPFRIQLSASQPSDANNDGVLLQATLGVNSSKEISSGSEKVWVKATGATNGTLTLQTDIEVKDFTGIDDRVYTGLQGLTTQPFTEANVKNGTQFSLSTEISLASGETKYLSFTTPNNTNDTLIKTRIISTDGGMRYTPRSGAVFTPDGSPLPIVNLNGKSANVSQVVVDTVDPLNVSNEGTEFDVIRSTSGQGSNREQGIFSGLGIERVLQRNASSLLKFENLDNQAIYVVFSVTWYEGPLSPDIL